MPPNLQPVTLKFTRRRAAKVIGSLADRDKAPKEGEAVKGILVTQNFNSKIIAAEELSTYTQLRVGSMSSKLHVPFAGQVETVRLFLNEMFSGVTEQIIKSDENVNTVSIFGLHENKVRNLNCPNLLNSLRMYAINIMSLWLLNQVTVTAGRTKGVATVEWDANPVGDLLADAIIALLMHAQGSAASIRITSQPCSHNKVKSEEPPLKKSREDNIIVHRLNLVFELLSNQFQDVESSYEQYSGEFTIHTGMTDADGNEIICTARVAFKDDQGTNAKIAVECVDGKVANNVRACLKNLTDAAAPIKLLG